MKKLTVLLLLLGLSSCYVAGTDGYLSVETNPNRYDYYNSNRYDYYNPYYYNRPYYYDPFYYPQRPSRIIIYSNPRVPQTPRHENFQPRNNYQGEIRAPRREFPKKDH
jgi:hypothetical protein